MRSRHHHHHVLLLACAASRPLREQTRARISMARSNAELGAVPCCTVIQLTFVKGRQRVVHRMTSDRRLCIEGSPVLCRAKMIAPRETRGHRNTGGVCCTHVGSILHLANTSAPVAEQDGLGHSIFTLAEGTVHEKNRITGIRRRGAACVGSYHHHCSNVTDALLRASLAGSSGSRQSVQA